MTDEPLPPAATPMLNTALCQECGEPIMFRPALMHLPKLWVHIETDELECAPDSKVAYSPFNFVVRAVRILRNVQGVRGFEAKWMEERAAKRPEDMILIRSRVPSKWVLLDLEERSAWNPVLDAEGVPQWKEIVDEALRSPGE